VSGNLVENCDGLENYDFCSVYKENNGNVANITCMVRMRIKFLAFTNDIKHRLPYWPMCWSCDVDKSMCVHTF